ncbi:hypothetical protein LTR17_010566 [Elasticomyces elasticus]|nr:hypothetical protein LTR17_010566 [Elasticomyces elasticus]
MLFFLPLSALLAVPAVLAVPTSNLGKLGNTDSSLTILFQNNPNGTDDVNHIAAILLDASLASQAAKACGTLNERLVSRAAIEAHYDDFYHQLSYLVYSGRANLNQDFIISNGLVSFNQPRACLEFKPTPYGNRRLPVLCTQSVNASQPTTAVATSRNEITVPAGGNNYVGYRNLKSWRFSGILYADQPQRWHHSSVYSGAGQMLNATVFGSQCLFLNIQTPYIPKAGSKQKLNAVYFWIHGLCVSLTAQALYCMSRWWFQWRRWFHDGGNLTSREDLVVVTINYRLSTLGFFAVPGTNITGNYGIGDQVTALQWTINNIAAFGGDPNQITIVGSLAGGASIRTLLGSPPAIGKFQGGIAQSSLGGGVTLGLPSNYATSSSMKQAGNATNLDKQIACLAAYDPVGFVGLPTIADKVVQDGTTINTEQLIVTEKIASTAHVPVMFETAADHGSSFSTYPKGNNITSELEGIQVELGISEYYAQSIIDSGLFPYYDTGNKTLDSFNVSQRIATDTQFRCIGEATVYAGAMSGAFERAYYYQSQRTEYGYDPNNLGGPPVLPGYPYGNPNLPYFRVHGSDNGWSFENLPVFRDAADLYSLQLEGSYYSWFAKTGERNAPLAYLKARGYQTVIEGQRASGPWDPVQGMQGPVKLLDWPSISSDFIDKPQCAFLNYSLTYYIDGGI